MERILVGLGVGGAHVAPVAGRVATEETEEVSTSVVPSPATWARLEQALWVLARLIRLLVQVVRLLLRPTGSDVARLAGQGRGGGSATTAHTQTPATQHNS